ncbi:MAG TPA: hypothetical protein VGA56_22170 [Opitutaceae bacterium]
MSENKPPFDIIDPTVMLKAMRNDSIETWSKMMVQFVHTDEYAQATGTILDAWLTSSGPFRKAIESSMAQVLAGLNMPTRSPVRYSRLKKRRRRSIQTTPSSSLL